MSISPRRIRVLPDAERVEDALLAAAESSRFVDGSRFLTFAQLVDAFEGAKQLGRRACSPLTARIVLQNAAREAGSGPFGAFVGEPAFARAALDLILELKAGRVSHSEFATAVESLPESRISRARFLARLYSTYERRMATLKLADREDVVRGAIEFLQRRGLPSRLQASRIEVAHLCDFPQLRVDFLIALASECDRSGISCRVEVPASGSAHLDGAVDPLFAEFERRGQSFRHVELEKIDLSAERPLGWLGASLFLPGEEPIETAKSSRLEVLSAGTAREEARLLARRARALVEEGTPPDRIAIAFRELDEEAEWLAEALEEVGLQARIRRGAPLASTAAGRLALELPLLVDDGFPAERISRIVTSRYAPPLSAGAPESPERLLSLAAIRDDLIGADGKRGAYEVRLTALASRLQVRLGEGKPNPARLLLERCTKLIELCNRIPEEGRCVELLRRWWSALGEIRFIEGIRRKEPRGMEDTALGQAVLSALARDQAAAEALQSLAAELEGALKLAGAESLTIHRRAFHRLLVDAAADFNLVPRGPRVGQVHVLDARELSGRRFAHVLIGGMADGRFPLRRMPHVLFPDEDRAAVNKRAGRAIFRLSAGEGEAIVPWPLAEDRLLFYLALCSSDEGVVLSYARQRPEGQEQLASPFLEELQRLTGAQLVHVPTQPAPALDDACSEAKLRERVAIEVLSRPELRASEPDPDRPSLVARFGKEEWLGVARELCSIEEERLRFFSNPDAQVGSFTGWSGVPELRARLSQLLQFGPDRPLSSSTLARFGKCAFRGYLALGVGLEEPEAPDEELDARGQGSFWHHVLEELFTRLKRAGLIGRAADEVPQALIDEALTTAADAAEQAGHVGHPLLWKLDRERARAMVARLLRTEHRGLPFEQLSPMRAELVFGREGADPEWREVRLPDLCGGPDVFVAGKIDRLDSGSDGVGVIDYKSGNISTAKNLVEELLVTDFQLPLYLYAIRSLGNRGNLDGALLSLKTGKVTQLEAALREHGDVRIEDLVATDAQVRKELEGSGRKNLANAVHSMLGKLRAGEFPIRPRDCSFCSFQPVCRITERRFQEIWT